jgi:hypothetical protein
MEIQELISYYVYNETKGVEVSFRLTTDSEDEVRNDLIDLSETTEFGYNLIDDNLDFFEFDEDLDEDFEDFQTIDEDVLISFLNEYYIVNPKKLPKAELI